ncbi:prenyltransferase/squalene oxidase repeat-containing protein [Streptomyces xanthophaeus]|uniref:prenyltransferase/squalene oxidase repeat-containing protein n=1 Tax=Streptomyces xanthophaeus TaxID=67385 RepID=UPI0004CD7306|nr:prenyltransferase/squalene oxidase repeat-containing protein [Streptomyces xanthophaeus]
MGTEEQAARHVRIGRRMLSLATASFLTIGAGVAFLTPTAANADPLDQCTATTGAVVAVDFGPFGGKVERGCDTTPTTGYELLHTAGFSTEGTRKDGDAFVCRLGFGSFNSGKQYPVPEVEDCVLTPQATGYWSYWHASPGDTKWTYSSLGAMSHVPQHGDVEAWVFGGTDVEGTNGKPKFTPAQVRAGGSGPSPEPEPDPEVPDVPPGVVDLAAATRWVGAKLKDGERVVVDGTTDPDYAATAEAVLALAAADPKSPAAQKAAGFLATPAHTLAYAYPAGKDAAPDATAAARLALVAEATGKDPRAFGGRDLLGDLVKYVCPSGADIPEPLPGCVTKGDFRTANQADGQAMALIALLNGGVTPPADAVTRLTGLQCEDGGFTGIMIRPEEACDSDPAASTLVLLALKRAGGHGPVVAEGTAFLRKMQLRNGGTPGAPGGTTGNAYMTAFASQALRALGNPARADAALFWLSSQQLDGGAFSSDEGATDPLFYATTAAVLAAAKTDLVTLTTKKAEPPKPSPDPTTPGPTPPAGDGPDLKKGTAYLTDRARLVQGRYYENAPGSGFADYGMTIDGAYALAATGQDNTALRNIVDFLDKGGKDGTGRGVHDWTMTGTKYAGGGSIGKTAVLAEAVGRDPRNFGGKDLIAALAKGICPAKSPAPDRACADKGNYSHADSVFSQSLGVIAQVRAGESAAAAEPIAYLKSLQDPSGAWRSVIGKDSKLEVDSTAMAAMTLDLLPDAGSQAAVDKALAWLAGQQLADGGFPGASGNSVNSAALAVQGLSLDSAKYADRIAKARKFLASQQNADGGFNIAKGAQPGSDVRASTQAVGGTTGISFATLTRSLDGTTPEPVPSSSVKPSAPAIVTPGEDAGGTGSSGGPRPAGGSLASTGAQIGGLAAAAVVLVLGGWGVTRATRTARSRRSTTGGGA